MKYIRQFTIILFISLAGEIIHLLVPLPVPASIYGLLIMLIGLRKDGFHWRRLRRPAHFL